MDFPVLEYLPAEKAQNNNNDSNSNEKRQKDHAYQRILGNPVCRSDQCGVL